MKKITAIDKWIEGEPILCLLNMIFASGLGRAYAVFLLYYSNQYVVINIIFLLLKIELFLYSFCVQFVCYLLPFEQYHYDVER